MPSSGEIQPGEAKDIRVKFCPDHVSAGYFDYILVDVPN